MFFLYQFRKQHLINKTMKLEKSIDNLKKALQTDAEYRATWQANIAMAYIDNYSWYKSKKGKVVMNNEDLHIIANKAADYFLGLLCDEHKAPKGR